MGWISDSVRSPCATGGEALVSEQEENQRLIACVVAELQVVPSVDALSHVQSQLAQGRIAIPDGYK